MFFAAVVEKGPTWYERECLPQRIDKDIAQLAHREKRRLTNDLLAEQAASNCNGHGDSGIAGKTRST